MNTLKRFFILTILVLTTFVVNARVLENAEKINKVADLDMEMDSILFLPKISYEQIVLTISIPNGEVLSFTYQSWDTPEIDLADERFANFTDGQYSYEIHVFQGFKNRSETKDTIKQKTYINRDNLTQSGYFRIVNGQFVGWEDLEEPIIEKPETNIPLKKGASSGDTPVTEDQLILDDLIVDGSACIGMDCVNGESFGFDTIRLKENNLRIKFQDTSSTSAFPTRDWQLTANDSANGGANKFSIDDIDAGRTPFTVEAGAPSNSLYVDDYGRIGIKTSTPVVELHIADGDTPTVRLEQNGTGGWTPQTWDLAGNEANFFIRDVTNGSRLPFRIQPAAPSDSITIKSDGKVGIGTWYPVAKLHVKGDSDNPNALVVKNDGKIGIGIDNPLVGLHMQGTGDQMRFIIQRTDGATFKLAPGTGAVQIGTMTNHAVKFYTNNTRLQMTINTNGSVVMGNGASCTVGGVWTNASSRKLKENIQELSAEEAIDALDKLEPVKYNYKREKDEEYVGFIAEDVPDLVATKNKDSMSAMDVTAVLTKVIKEQQKLIKELQARVEKLENNK